MNLSNEQKASTDFNFSPAELSTIYLGLSQSTENFDELNEQEKLLEIINQNFNEKLKNIDNKKLINNEIILNKSFLKFWYISRNYKIQIHKVFIFYCDYYDLDYNLVYNKLAIKLKNKIENDLILLIGGFKSYEKIKSKFKIDNNNTLFDLV